MGSPCIRFVEASAESHRCFSRQPGPGSDEGRYDGYFRQVSRGHAMNADAQHTIQKTFCFSNSTHVFFGKTSHHFVSFKYQSFFETSENLSHFYKFILSFLRRVAMISTFRIHPL